MFRYLFLLPVALLFCIPVNAQKPGRLVYYMNNSGKAVHHKDSADYFMFIMPPDTSTGNTLFPIKEYYPNGNPKLLGSSITNSYNALEFEGTCMEFFNSGVKKKVTIYENGSMPTYITYYYPNGKIYKVTLYDDHRKLKLISCRDTTGNVLADNGNGKWLTWNEEFTVLTGQGLIKDSLKNGQWSGMMNDTVKYDYLYKNGDIQSGVSYEKSGKAYPFKLVNVLPICPYQPKFLYNFLSIVLDLKKYGDSHNIKYPSVLFSFDVEKDGTLTNVKIINGLDDEYYAKRFLDAVKKLPSWQPGKIYGIAAKYTEIITYSVDYISTRWSTTYKPNFLNQ